MPILYTNRDNLSAAFNAAVGSRIGATPMMELLIFKGTTFFDTNGDWNAGTHNNTQASAGTLNVVNAANPGTWVSKVVDLFLHSAYLDFSADRSPKAGTVIFQVRTGTTNALDDLAWNTIAPNSILGIDAGRYAQYRILMNPTGSVSPLVNSINMESWYAPRLDPLSGLIQFGNLGQRTERMMNEFVVELGVVRAVNSTGWWNFNGALANSVGSSISRISKNAAAQGTPGTYQTWNYVAQVNSFLQPGDDVWDTYAPTSFDVIQEGTGTCAFGAGTWVVTAGTSTGTLHDDPTIGPFIGTAGLTVKWLAGHPGTTGIMIDTNTIWNGPGYGNMSGYLFVGSQGPGAPKLHLFVTSGAGVAQPLPPSLGTIFGSGTIANASLPTGSWTRFSFPFTTTAASVYPRFKLMQLGTHYLEVAIAGLQMTAGTPFLTNTNGTFLKPFRPVTSGMFVHGVNVHMRGTVASGNAYTNLLQGVTVTVAGTINDGDVANMTLGPFYAPKYVFNEQARLWSGYKYGWTGSSWGTQEFLPSFRGFVDGVTYSDTGECLLAFRNVAKLLKNATGEKVTQQPGVASGTWWVDMPVHFLVNELVKAANWGTNNVGTIDALNIRPTDFGTTVVTIGTLPSGTAFAAYYENRGTLACWGTLGGTTNTGTLYIGVGNKLYESADPFSAATLIGTVASNWTIDYIFGIWKSGGVAVRAWAPTLAYSSGVGFGSWGMWSQQRGTQTMTLLAQFGSQAPEAWGAARHAVRRGTFDSFIFIDVDNNGGGGTRIAAWEAGPDIGAVPSLYKSIDTSPSATILSQFMFGGDIGFCGTNFQDFYVGAGPYLLRFGNSGTYGTIGTLNSNFTNLSSLHHNPTTGAISCFTNNVGTKYFSLLVNGSMYDGIGTWGSSTVNVRELQDCHMETLWPHRLFVQVPGGCMENVWTGTFGTIAPLFTGTNMFTLVHAPSGTMRLLMVEHVTGTNFLRSYKDWLVPRPGTANWGAQDIAQVIGDLAESVGYVTYINELGVFQFRERIGTFGTTGTLNVSDIPNYTIRYSETQALSPLINRMTFALFGQAGSTVVQDTPSIGTYGTHSLNVANLWFQDYSDGIKQAIMGQYVQRYRYPKNILEMTSRYDPRRYLDELVKVTIPAINLSLDQTWRVVEIGHLLSSSKTSLVLREES